MPGFAGSPRAMPVRLHMRRLRSGGLFLDHRSAIKDIEINPLIVRRSGSGAVAVDVRVMWHTEQGG